MTRDDTKARRAAQRIRKLVGWKFSGNIRQAADEIGVNYFTLYNGLSGRNAPGADMIAACAGYFGVTVDSLMAEDEPRRRRARR